MRDPKAEGVAPPNPFGDDEAPFCCPLGDLAELASRSLRNCSLFIFHDRAQSKRPWAKETDNLELIIEDGFVEDRRCEMLVVLMRTLTLPHANLHGFKMSADTAPNRGRRPKALNALGRHRVSPPLKFTRTTIHQHRICFGYVLLNHLIRY